jgi:tetratricopeptide (TPR) repeat protein
VDGPALRSLLEHERFADLSRYLEELQRQFEADPTKELWTVRAVESFASASPELLPKLDAWVAANPASFAPHAARGAYWVEVAWSRRGTKLARDTPDENFKGMHDAADLARKDLRQALLHNPEQIAVLRQQVALSIPTSDDDLRKRALRDAERVCPTCFSVRSKNLVGLAPRWGGSYREMDDFAARAPAAENPRLRLLRGYADDDRAKVALREEKLDEALGFADRACSLGPHWDFLQQRAQVRVRRDDFERALGDLDAAIELRPDLPGLRLDRARVREKRREWEAAGRDLIESMRLDAGGELARWLLPRIVQGLSADGYSAHQRGDRERAIRLLDLALQLSPFDREVQKRREEAVRGNVQGTPDEIARLEALARDSPNDFRALQHLDYALAKQKRYDRVIELWTEYLARHPHDGPAYFERSGAHFNSGRKTEALSDLAKACELGVNQACAYQQRLKGK